MSRWEITQVKRKIRSTDFENHSDDLELTGEKVSGLIKYSVKDGILKIGKLLFYPEYRLQPDNTHASFKIADESPSVELTESEKFISVEIDGTLTFETVSGNLEITRKFYPSAELPIFYEDVIIKNKGKTSEKIKVNSGRLKTTLTCQGYVYTERLCDNAPLCVECGETVKVTFSYVTYYADAAIPEEEDALRKRYDRVDELFETVKQELVNLIKQNPDNADQAILFMMIAKYLERIGDHAVNIGEWVEYAATGYHRAS